jgi:hypothetical protein
MAKKLVLKQKKLLNAPKGANNTRIGFLLAVFTGFLYHIRGIK